MFSGWRLLEFGNSNLYRANTWRTYGCPSRARNVRSMRRRRLRFARQLPRLQRTGSLDSRLMQCSLGPMTGCSPRNTLRRVLTSCISFIGTLCIVHSPIDVKPKTENEKKTRRRSSHTCSLINDLAESSDFTHAVCLLQMKATYRV